MGARHRQEARSKQAAWHPGLLPLLSSALLPRIEMDNVLIDRSASGFELRRWAAASASDDDLRSFAMSALPPHTRSSFPYVSPLLAFQYEPYLHSSLSLPPLHPRRLPLPPPVAAAAMAKRAAPAPNPAAAKGKPAAAPRRTSSGPAGEYKRKKPPRTPPRLGEEPPRAQQRRKPLERATPLPPALAVHEALDDLERQVTRGFVDDLVHALAPPPSRLPLPTFSLLRAATPKAAVPSCTV